MPHKRNPIVAERICGLARVVRADALVGLENVALWHERDISHSSAERVVLPDAFLALDYMLDRFAWLVEGLVVRPSGCARTSTRATASSSASALLLALVEAGLARDEAYRLVQRHAMRAWDEELDFRELVARRPARSPARRRRSTRSSTSAATPATSTPSSTACTPSTRRRSPSMPETAVHVGSGKVRELYALDDERLLLVATDRISTFDVVLPTEIPDKGRVLTGLSAFWFARTRDDRAEPPARAARRTAARPSAGGSRCCRSSASSAATSPARAGRTTSATGAVCGHALPAGPARVGPAAGADLHAGDEGRRRATTRTSTREQAAELVGDERFAEVERDRRSRSTRFAAEHAARARDHHRRHEVRVRARRATGGSCSATRCSRRTPRASGRPTSTSPGGPQPSFDKQFVRDYCETLGWDKTAPGPGAARRRRRRHARALRRGVRAADRASRSTTTSPTRRWCSR